MKKIVLLVVCMIGFAIGGEHVIGGATGSNFSTDSLSADSIGVGWPNALKIEVGDSIYTSLLDTIFSDIDSLKVIFPNVFGRIQQIYRTN